MCFWGGLNRLDQFVVSGGVISLSVYVRYILSYALRKFFC